MPDAAYTYILEFLGERFSKSTQTLINTEGQWWMTATHWEKSARVINQDKSLPAVLSRRSRCSRWRPTSRVGTEPSSCWPTRSFCSDGWDATNTWPACGRCSWSAAWVWTSPSSTTRPSPTCRCCRSATAGAPAAVGPMLPRHQVHTCILLFYQFISLYTCYFCSFSLLFCFNIFP